MKKHIKYKKVYSILLLNIFMILKIMGNGSQDSLQIKRTNSPRKLSFLFTAGYRIPLNNNIIINSGHGIYLEGGFHTGRLLSEKFSVGLFGGFALQDKFWNTAFKNDFSSDYSASINKDKHFSEEDSAIIYSSADLFKNTKGNSLSLPGCATQSFHNFSLYYGLVFNLPFKYFSYLKAYMGTTRTYYRGDGNIATKQGDYTIFELARSMYGCELSLLNFNFKSAKQKEAPEADKYKKGIGLSVYYERCDFYNSFLYFDDGKTTRKMSLQSFTNTSFLYKYKTEVSWGIKLFFFLR